jgi:rhamnosyltransferase
VKSTVLIRAKDEAAAIGRTLDLVAAADEVVVVDSGSRDDTGAIARRAGARVIDIPAGSFTYGRALNVGCAAATGDVVIALSAHAFPPDAGWVERITAEFADDRVACACGYDSGPDGSPLTGRVEQDAALLRNRPLWGYTNASGAFRRSLWLERRFREDLPGTEDKEWAAYWIERGFVCIADPALAVEHGHDDEDLRETYARAEREWRGFAMYADLSPYPVGALAREWWSARDGRSSAARARFSPRRIVQLGGKYVGRRRGLAR